MLIQPSVSFNIRWTALTCYMKPVRKFVGRKVSCVVMGLPGNLGCGYSTFNSLPEARTAKICVYRTKRLAVTDRLVANY